MPGGRQVLQYMDIKWNEASGLLYAVSKGASAPEYAVDVFAMT
jgi:hypothetical protein